MARVLIALAAVLLPSTVRDEFRAEWLAEATWIEKQGESSLPFAMELLRGAPSTSIASRSGSSLAFAELSVALLFGVVSSAFFAVASFGGDMASMGVAYVATTIGTLMISVGLWREETGLLHGRVARFGLLFVGLGRAFLATVPIHIPTQSELVARDDYALTVVAIGAFILFVAQLPRFRNMRWTRFGLIVAGVGSLAGGMADIINLIALDEPLIVELSLVIAAIAAFGAGIATLVVVRRDVVFESVDPPAIFGGFPR